MSALALLGAAASVLGSSLSSFWNSQNASDDRELTLDLFNKNREFQNEDKDWSLASSKELADYQYNKFNSPSVQMQAYKDAGINPYLVAQGGSVGSGQGTSVAPPNPSQRGQTPELYRRPDMDSLQGPAQAIFQASSVRSQRIDAMAKFTESLPALVKGLGKESATRIAGALFGQDINMSRIDSMIQNEALQQQYNAKISEVKSVLMQKYGDKQVSNILALQEQEFNKMAAEVRLMASQGRLNDANIEKLASDYIRNLADALKLKKEGDYFVASASQAAAMSDLVSLQGKKLSFENREAGYYEGSGLDDYLNGKYHSGKTADMRRILENAEGSELVKALDRVLGKYLKISSGM